MQRNKLRLLFDHLVGASQKRRRDSEAERLCSLETDCKLEFDRLLDRKQRKKRVFAVGTRVTSRPSRSVRAALDKAEQAHRRSDALDKRRKLMEAWPTYCEPKGSVTVVQMRKRKWIEGAYS